MYGTSTNPCGSHYPGFRPVYSDDSCVYAHSGARLTSRVCTYKANAELLSTCAGVHPSAVGAKMWAEISLFMSWKTRLEMQPK